MKSGRLLLTVSALILSLSLSVICGCSTDAVPDDEVVDITLSNISVAAVPNSINLNETTTVEAIAYDESGNTMANVDIVFTIDDPTLAYVTSVGTTDRSGVAQVMLTSRGKIGEVNVTASSGEVLSDPPATVYIQKGDAPSQIFLTVTPASLVAGGAVSVRAQVLASNGDPVADGTAVSFTSDIATMGDFTAPSATTTNGFATATFKAEEQITGTASVTVECRGVSAQTSIVIVSADANSIEFVSADPTRIPIQGSGGIETSKIQFLVNDSNGNPLNGEPVYFTLFGPGGGEYITPTQSSTDENGIAQVILQSGGATGPVTIEASIFTDTGLEITSQSSVVSIGGGVPSEKRFSVAADRLSLPGLEENGVETNITAYLADRYGNYNMLSGTTVSFITEKGLAIDTSEVTVDESGTATAVAYTQYSVGSYSACEDVAEDPWETELLDYIESTYYGATLPGNPRDGLCSVMVYVEGEEHFYDEIANGVYDAGENFVDTHTDPFIDYNDDEMRDDGSFDPFEEYIDSGTQNGVWDDKNGVWDSNKNIFSNFKILLTGQPYLIRASKPVFVVGDGDYVYFSIIVCDRNGNFLNGGSTVTVSHEGGGTLTGITEYVFPDNGALGPLELFFYLSDTYPDDDVDDPDYFYIYVTVNWQGEYSTSETKVLVAQGTVK